MAKELNELRQNPDESETDNSIVLNFCIQGICAAGMFIFYMFYRRKLKWLYTPNVTNKPRHPGYPYKNSKIAWVKPLLNVNDQQMINIAGLDAFMFLQTCRMLFRILMVACVVLLPLSFVYFRKGTAETQVFFMLSIQNYPKFPHGITVVLVYIITMISLYIVYIYYKRFITLRQAYLVSPSSFTSIPCLKRLSFDLCSVEKAIYLTDVQTRTVLIRRIPSDVKHIGHFVRKLGAGTPVNITLVKNATEICDKMEIRYRLIKRVEDIINRDFKALGAEYANFDNTHDPNEVDSELELPAVKKVELFVAYIEASPECDNLKRLMDEILTIHESLLDDVRESLKFTEDCSEKQDFSEILEIDSRHLLNLPDECDVSFFDFRKLFMFWKHLDTYSLDVPIGMRSAFVTFECYKNANILSQCLISSKPVSVKSKPAESPLDIIWGNIMYNELAKAVRYRISLLALYTINILFYTVIFNLVSYIRLENLELVAPSLKPITQIPMVRRTYKGTIIPQIYGQVLGNIYILIEIIIKYEKPYSQSEADLLLMNRCGIFYFVNGTFALFFSGTFSTTIKTIINKDTTVEELISDLGASFGIYSVLFLNMIIQRILTGHGMALVKPVQLFLLRIFASHKNRREKLYYANNFYIKYGVLYPNLFITFPTALMFGVLNPVITLFGACYFFFAYYIYKSEFIFSGVTKNETGGSHWPTICNHVIYSIIWFNITTIFQFFSMGKTTCALALTPLAFLSYMAIGYFKRTFDKRMKYCPLNIVQSDFTNRFTSSLIKKHRGFLDEWVDDFEDRDPDIIQISEFYSQFHSKKTSDVDITFGGDIEHYYVNPAIYGKCGLVILPRNFFRAMHEKSNVQALTLNKGVTKNIE